MDKFILEKCLLLLLLSIVIQYSFEVYQVKLPPLMGV